MISKKRACGPIFNLLDVLKEQELLMVKNRLKSDTLSQAIRPMNTPLQKMFVIIGKLKIHATGC
jgi:hypothetical protein